MWIYILRISNKGIRGYPLNPLANKVIRGLRGIPLFNIKIKNYLISNYIYLFTYLPIYLFTYSATFFLRTTFFFGGAGAAASIAA